MHIPKLYLIVSGTATMTAFTAIFSDNKTGIFLTRPRCYLTLSTFGHMTTSLYGLHDQLILLSSVVMPCLLDVCT